MVEETRGRPSPDARQLNVLIRMLHSKDATERNVAVRALRDASPEGLCGVLSDPALHPETLDFFARHAGSRSDWVQALLVNPGLTDSAKEALFAVGDLSPVAPEADLPAAASSETKTAGEEEVPPEAEKELTLSQQIAKMGVGQKIKLAMKGDKEARSILIKDTNREVYMSVLNNPGLKENEIEMLVKSTGTSTDILRVIGKNREWISKTAILKGLIMNPKTPVEISIRYLTRLGRKDLENVDRTRNLPAALRATAKRLIAAKKKG